jgi:myo-inositol-1-phosphate synthase
MTKIRIAMAGIGNCASSLIQGIEYYRDKEDTEQIGLMHYNLGGYKPHDIKVVAAFDTDKRKVGKDVAEAMFAPPNCTTVFCKDIPSTGVKVHMGRIMDSFSEHMKDYEERFRFVLSSKPEPSEEEVVRVLKESRAEILLNYLPVGSEEATRFYASDPDWAARFEERDLPLIGDDIKSQLGATIVHRVLTNLFIKRGVKLERTYQLNTGGNTDFLNMLNRSRLLSKKKSKTESVQSQLGEERLDKENIHIGPSDWVAWQKDNKVGFIRMEGKLFGDIPMNLELRLSVEDSPNSAGVVIDAIRCAKLALIRKEGGVLYAPAAYFFKHPPRQYTDEEAYRMTKTFINGTYGERRHEMPDHSSREGQQIAQIG